ncbi:MAG: hypothetical protein AAGA87_08725 [Pseudomonadota bacterium]
MKLLPKIITAAVVAALPMAAGAATLTTAENAPGAAGNSALNVTANAPGAVVFAAQTAGTLETLSLWVDIESNAIALGEDLILSLFGKHTTPFPNVQTDFLFGRSFSTSELLAAPQIVGGDGGTYAQVTWDVSAADLEVAEDEVFALRAAAEGPGGQYRLNANNCNALNASFCPPTSPMTQFSGTPTFLGNNGSPAFVWSFSASVEVGNGNGGGGVTPVPLPAGLPLLLAGLVGLSVLRTRR